MLLFTLLFASLTIAAPAHAQVTTITSISPNSGPAEGGTSVDIFGANFTGALEVSFGGSPAFDFAVISDTQITATTDHHPQGTVDVTVVTPSGSDTAAGAYTFDAPVELFLMIGDAWITEGNLGSNFANFTISLNQPVPQHREVTFDIATADGTATAGDDYIARSVTGQRIAEGNATSFFAVEILGDTNPEPDEIFFVNVTNVVGATLADGQGIGTIVDDDMPAGPAVSWSAPGGSAVINATVGGLALAPGDTVPAGSVVVFRVKPEDGMTYTEAPWGCTVHYVDSDASGDRWQTDPLTAYCAVQFRIAHPGLFPSQNQIPIAALGQPYGGAQLSTQIQYPPFTVGTWTYSGDLPEGLNLSASGLLSGTPLESGTFTFHLTFTNGAGHQIRGTNFTITVVNYNAELSALSLSEGVLTPGFSSGTTHYSATVPYDVETIAVTAAADNTNATIVVNGQTLTSGSTSGAIPLAVGITPIAVVVTSQNGMTAKTYTVSVMRQNALPPQIGGIVPNSGPSTGGTSVVITGTNFSGTTQVMFGSSPAVGFVVNSPTQITAATPAQADGSVAVAVTTPVGTYVLPDAFIFTAPPPTASPVFATVASNSGNNPITLSITGAPASSVAVATGPSNGTATVSGPTTIVYRPASDYAGPDSFTYTATGAAGTSAPATVTISVIDPPLQDFAVTTEYETPLDFSVVNNGVSGYFLAVAPINGTVILDADGSARYTPNVGYSGADEFQYDAGISGNNTGTVTITVTQPTVAYEPTNPTAGFVGVFYSQSIAGGASGGKSPYTFAHVSGTMVSGLMLADDGTLSGTPTAAGTVTFNVVATDSSTGSGPFSSPPAAVSVTIGQVAPTITAISPNIGAPGTSVTIEGTHLLGTTSVFFGDVPATGINVVDNSTVIVTAPPHASGQVDVRLNTGGGSSTVTNGFTYIPTAPIANPISVTVAYGGQETITPDVTGGAATFMLASTSIHGTVMVHDSLIVYTPTAGYAGPDTFSYTAGNASGASTSTVSITVAPPTIVYNPASPPVGTVGVSYSQSLAGASGGMGPYSYALASGSAVPPGLGLDTDGTLSGIPASPGTFTFSVIATDRSFGTGPFSSAAANVSVTIDSSLPNIVSVAPNGGPTTGGTVVTITGTGFTTATAVAFGSVEATGLTLNSDTSISVTTPAQGAGPVPVSVTAPGGSDALLDAFVYEQTPSNDATLSNLFVSDGNLSPGFTSAGTSYTVSVPHAVDTLTLSPTATHPSATIQVDGQAVGSGSPSAAIPLAIGNSAISVAVTAEDGATVRVYTVTVTRAAPTITVDPATLANGVAGMVYGPATLTANGGTAPYAFSVTAGALPANLSLSPAGELSGMPTASGGYSFTIAATDVNGFTGHRDFALVIDAPVISVSVPPLPRGKVNTPFAPVSLSASGGSDPYGFTVTGGELPQGMVLSADGTLSGTPAEAGDFSLIVTATDRLGYAGTGNVLIRIKSLDLPIAQSLSLRVMAGTSGTIDLTQGATNGPFTGAAISVHPADEAGRASIHRDGAAYILDFAAANTFQGSANLQYTLSNAEGRSAPVTVTLTVIARPDPSRDPDVIGLMTAQAEAAKRFARTQTQNFNQRLEQLHDEGERRRNSMHATMSLQRSDSARAAYAKEEEHARIREAFARVDANSQEVAKPSPTAFKAVEDDNPLGEFALWFGGFVKFAEADNGGINLDSTLVGVSGGIDYRFTPKFIAGVGFGYGRDKTEVGTNRTESLGQAWSMSAYGSYKPTPEIFIDGLLGYSLMNFDSRRFTVAGDFANGLRDGRQVFGSLTAGYELRRGGWLLSPYGRLEASRSTLDAFTETGTGIWDLSYGQQTIDTLSGILGLRLEYAVPMEWGVLKPRARVEYTHDFDGSSRVGVGYADIGTLSYMVETGAFSKDNLTIGLGLDAQFGDGWTLGFDYRTAYGSGGRQQDHTFAIKFSGQF